jgi:hypothetical protein
VRKKNLESSCVCGVRNGWHIFVIVPNKNFVNRKRKVLRPVLSCQLAARPAPSIFQLKSARIKLCRIYIPNVNQERGVPRILQLAELKCMRQSCRKKITNSINFLVMHSTI